MEESDKKKELNDLFHKYLNQETTPAESAFVEKYYDFFEEKGSVLADMPVPEKEMLENRMLSDLHRKMEVPSSRPVAPVSFLQKKWWWAAAVLVLVAGGISAYFFFSIQSSDDIIASVSPVEDVEAPKTNKATITLADGSVVTLDSLGTLTQNNVQLTRNANGQLVYEGNASEMVYNTLTNPRGSQVIDVTLSDGSRVWLNAASSITYPVAFSGSERKVQMTGEAYFEVSHDREKPFIVSKGAIGVQVLGTRFNVNAYDDEWAVKVTLLEGSVRVENERAGATGRHSMMLKPGEQAVMTRTSIMASGHINMEEVMAWKNGLFEFNETDIQTVMRQIERWYEVEVVFNGNVFQHFNGTIQREVNVSKVLDMLEKTGGVRFSIKGKKVTVSAIQG